MAPFTCGSTATTVEALRMQWKGELHKIDVVKTRGVQDGHADLHAPFSASNVFLTRFLFRVG
jgi:hypothetical protein